MEHRAYRTLNKEREYRKHSLLAWGFILFEVAAILFFLFYFVLTPVRVNDISMQPTFESGEILLLDKVSLYLRTPVRGSVVAFKNPDTEEILLKRIIALPGETVQIKEGKVYINGRFLDESAYVPTPFLDYDAFVVPKGFVFVLGDNRMEGKDSRSIGPIPLHTLRGRAALRVSPFSRISLFLY